MSTFVKKNIVPETVTGEEGTAKRNIIRKGSPRGSAGRKDITNKKSVDDGSLFVDGNALDDKDPNFDSEDETGFAIPKRAALHRDKIARSKLTLTSYKKKVEPLIAFFFVNEDINDIAGSILEIEAPEYSYEFVKRLVSMSLDKGDRERELVSRLFCALFPDILSSNTIGKGFERLFEIADEIEKDAPNAKNAIAIFLARAVVDEVLPPSFLADSVVCNLGGEMVEHAKIMLSQDHAGAKLERSWGPGDGRPVEDMKVAVDQILQEYLLSGDVEEAARCLFEMRVPHFYHEIVKRAVINALDEDEAKQIQMSALLDTLATKESLSNAQAVRGFNRLYSLLPDLVLDTPSAGQMLKSFTLRAVKSGVLPPSFAPPAADDRRD